MEKPTVTKSLKTLFPSAYNIFVDDETKYCEVSVSIDDYQGIITNELIENGISFQMVDYWDVFPFKYVFSYR